jgi:hypothetical protein
VATEKAIPAPMERARRVQNWRGPHWRQIFLDGPALEQDPNPSWMGYSVGRWEGDTLAVDSAGTTTGPGWTAAIRTRRRCTSPRADAVHLVACGRVCPSRPVNRAKAQRQKA